MNSLKNYIINYFIDQLHVSYYPTDHSFTYWYTYPGIVQEPTKQQILLMDILNHDTIVEYCLLIPLLDISIF